MRHVGPIVLVAIFVTFSVTFYFISPDDILNVVGVENAYLLMFVLALLGGLSTFSGVPYHLILVGLASGGLDPWLLGLIAAGGVMTGDSTSYLLGKRGSELLSARMMTVLTKLKVVEERVPRLMPVVYFLYGACVPLSNDILVIPAGLIGYPFWRIMLPLGLGNVVFNVGLALVAVYATGYVAVFL